MSVSKVMELISRLIDLEKQITTELKKEKDAKRRKKLAKACKERDLSAIRDLLFKL